MKKFQLLKWTAEVDCLLLMEVEVDEDGNIEEYEYLNICYPEEE